jgi:hypothetical protein
MCTSYELNDLVIFAINVHVSSKDLEDRRNQVMKILHECLDDFSEDLDK